MKDTVKLEEQLCVAAVWNRSKAFEPSSNRSLRKDFHAACPLGKIKASEKFQPVCFSLSPADEIRGLKPRVVVLLNLFGLHWIFAELQRWTAKGKVRGDPCGQPLKLKNDEYA